MTEKVLPLMPPRLPEMASHALQVRNLHFQNKRGTSGAAAHGLILTNILAPIMYVKSPCMWWDPRATFLKKTQLNTIICYKFRKLLPNI